MKKGLLFLFLMMFFSSFSLMGQSKDVTGTVVSATDGFGLPTVSVAVKGTTRGVYTDLLGLYNINVEEGETLVFSYLGFQTQEFVVGSNNTYNITLEENAEVLNEVVIVGYGVSSKQALTGSVTTLRPDRLEQVPLASVEQTLQGNVAGLQSMAGSGQPGSNVQIRIRGIGSISASSEPLYVIDGIPVIAGDVTRSNTTANTMASLNPNDIATLTVLKDASATSIYGSRGANGVILITTKNGKKGKPKVSLKTQVGYNDWAVPDSRQLRSLNSRQYTEMYLEGWMNRGESLERAIERFEGHYPGAVDFGPNGDIQNINVETDWLDLVQRNGANSSYDLSISGGSDVFTYFASAGYFKQEAPIIYSGLERYSSRLNLSASPSDKLTITNNLNISYLDQKGMSGGSGWANPIYNSLFLAPVIPLKDEQGRFYGDHKSFFMGGNNPVGSLSGDDERFFTQTRIMDMISGEYEIIEGLKFKSQWAFDLLNVQEFFYRNGRYGDGRNVGGSATESIINRLNYIGTQTLSYNTILSEKHSLTALAGYEAQKDEAKRVFTRGTGFPNPVLRTLASAANPTDASSDLSEYSFASLFGRLDYNFNSKYYLSLSLRRDGSSRFGINNRHGTFWSVGASWRLSEEAFLANNSFVDDLKLRISYGTNGNAGIGNYDHIPLFGFGADYDGVPGGGASNIGNVDLTWESNTAFNIGLDFAIASRFDGTIEYFDRESDNLLLDRPISRTTGFSSLTQNFGAMRNSGLELTLNATVLSGEKFNWSVGGNITFLKNEITRLDEEIVDGTKIRREGLDFQSYYMFEWAGVNPDDGTPLWYTDLSKTETTGDVRSLDRLVSGRSATPDWFGGFNTNISYGDFGLDAQFSSSWGNYIYDATARFTQGDGALTPRSQTHLNLSRWQNPGDVTDVPYFRWGGNNRSNSSNMTRWLHDASFVRLRNLTLSYSLPADLVKKVKVNNARVYFRAVNLWTYTKDSDLYLDPEAQVSGIVSSPIPNVKTITFGLDLGF